MIGELIHWRYIYLYFFVISIALSMLLVPLFRIIALRLNVIDKPGDRKIHVNPTPLLGGGAIFFSFALVIIAHYLIQPWIVNNPLLREIIPEYYMTYARGVWTVSPKLIIVFSGAIIISLVGIADDVASVSIRSRFLWEFLVAIVVVSAGLKPHIEILPEIIVWVLCVVWIVGITNSMNLLDVADGVSAGVGFISALLLAWVMHLGGQSLMALFLVVLAGSILGFLRFNFPPAKIFLGSWGSMFLGYILSVSVLLSYEIPAGENPLFPLIIPVLILGIPLYDTFSVILIRILTGQPIVLADRNHFAHRLMHAGFSIRQAIALIYLLTLCIGINATLLVKTNTFFGLIILTQIMMTFGVIIILERVMFNRRNMMEKVLRDAGLDHREVLSSHTPFDKKAASQSVDSESEINPKEFKV